MKNFHNAGAKKAFAGKLRALLEARNMSQNELALAVWNATYTDARGYTCVRHRDLISSYCRGRSVPSPATLKKIASALGVSASELLPGGGYGVDFQPTPAAPVNALDLSVDHNAPGMLRVQIDVLLPAEIAAQIAATVVSHTSKSSAPVASTARRKAPPSADAARIARETFATFPEGGSA